MMKEMLGIEEGITEVITMLQNMVIAAEFRGNHHLADDIRNEMDKLRDRYLNRLRTYKPT